MVTLIAWTCFGFSRLLSHGSGQLRSVRAPMFKRLGSSPQTVQDWTDSTDLVDLYRGTLTLGTDFDLDEGVIEGADFCIAYPLGVDKLPR